MHKKAEMGILNVGLDVVAREEPGDAVHDPLPPSVVVLLEDVDGGALGEAQLVLLVGVVVVNGGHL